MTPVQVVFSRPMQGRFGIDDEYISAPEWELSMHWTQRCVYATRGAVKLCIPLEACIVRYEGNTPKGPGRPEKGGS